MQNLAYFEIRSRPSSSNIPHAQILLDIITPTRVVMLKLYFYTESFRIKAFRSILITFSELLNINKAYNKT